IHSCGSRIFLPSSNNNGVSIDCNTVAKFITTLSVVSSNKLLLLPSGPSSNKHINTSQYTQSSNNDGVFVDCYTLTEISKTLCVVCFEVCLLNPSGSSSNKHISSS